MNARVRVCTRAGRLQPAPQCAAQRAVSPTGFFRAYTFWTLSEARSRLYQRRFLRPRPHFPPFFELYTFFLCTIPDFCDFSSLCTIFCKISRIFCGFSKETADFTNFRQISTYFSGILQNFNILQKMMPRLLCFREIWEILQKFRKISLQNCWNFVWKKVTSKCLRW